MSWRVMGWCTTPKMVQLLFCMALCLDFFFVIFLSLRNRVKGSGPAYFCLQIVLRNRVLPLVGFLVGRSSLRGFQSPVMGSWC